MRLKQFDCPSEVNKYVTCFMVVVSVTMNFLKAARFLVEGGGGGGGSSSVKR